MIGLLQQLRGRRQLVGNLVARELKSRYKGSFLGVLWSLLTPLFMAIIYMFFLRLLNRGVPIDQIIIGVFAWQFTVQAVQSGMESITGNANLVKKVFFPRVILPVSTTLAALVNYLLSLVIQFLLIGGLLIAHGQFFDPGTLLLPLLILYQTFFNLALSLCFSTSNVYFRDTQHLVGVFLSAWFFLSPAMYHLDLVTAVGADWPWVMKLYMLNPLAGLITGYRALLLPDVSWTPDAWAWAGFAWPIVFAFVAWALFRKGEKNFADML